MIKVPRTALFAVAAVSSLGLFYFSDSPKKAVKPQREPAYELKQDKMYKQLLRTPLPASAFTSTPPTVRVVELSKNQVEWRVAPRDNPRTLRIIATMHEDKHGRTAITVTMPEPSIETLTREGVKNPEALVEQCRAAMSEAIDAFMSKRAFNTKLAFPPL
jgi:hypothetical protein